MNKPGPLAQDAQGECLEKALANSERAWAPLLRVPLETHVDILLHRLTVAKLVALDCPSGVSLNCQCSLDSNRKRWLALQQHHYEAV